MLKLTTIGRYARNDSHFTRSIKLVSYTCLERCLHWFVYAQQLHQTNQLVFALKNYKDFTIVHVSKETDTVLLDAL